MGGIVIDYPLYEARRQISMTVNDAMKRRLANMALLITGMIWGSGFVVMKNTLDSMSTNYILAIRFTIAALGLSYTLFTKGPVTFEKIKAGANLGLYIYGAFAVQTYGLMFTTPAKMRSSRVLRCAGAAAAVDNAKAPAGRQGMDGCRNDDNWHSAAHY